MFDIFTIIIFLALAVFIFLQLRSGLAQRTGRERPPYEVTLPSRRAKASPHPAKASQPPGDRWKGIAESGAPVAAGLDEIATADPSFDAKHFITGARTAYKTIVTSCAEGDRRQLRSLLSREAYNRFDAAITEREGRGETAETRFVSIDGSTVTAAELRGRSAQITVRFVSKLFSATRDRSGTVIDGNAEKVTDNREEWTFARNISSRDPNWKIVATAAEQ